MISSFALRRGGPADVPALLDLYLANGEIFPGDISVPRAYAEHLVASADLRVAQEGDEVVGFASVISAGPVAMLTDLFVHPDRHGGGIGQRLLAAAFGDRFPRATFASNDPRAVPLYIRSGLRPLWPAFYFEGEADRLPVTSAMAVRPAAPGEAADVERSISGIDRGREHAFWATLPDADPFVVLVDERPVATGHAHRDHRGRGRWLDRLLVAADCDVRGAIHAGLRFAGRGGLLSLAVPGPNPVVGDLLTARFRITDRDTYLASEPGLIDPERFLPHSGLL